jgi:hypothetical protein
VFRSLVAVAGGKGAALNQAAADRSDVKTTAATGDPRPATETAILATPKGFVTISTGLVQFRRLEC